MSRAAHLDEEQEVYDIPDFSNRKKTLATIGRGEDSLDASTASKRSIRRGGKKKTLQTDGPEGSHQQDTGCCHDKQCSIF